MIATSNRLQKEADNERLALFIGAGASFPSGLPSWAGLVEQLAITAGFTETERAALAKLSVLDQATLIQERFGSEHAFKKEVAKCVEVGRYTPAHAILSSLELAAITTNYDPLYENAARSGGLTVHLMPWDTAMLGEASGKVDEASMSKPGIARKNTPKPKRGSAPEPASRQARRTSFARARASMPPTPWAASRAPCSPSKHSGLTKSSQCVAASSEGDTLTSAIALASSCAGSVAGGLSWLTNSATCCANVGSAHANPPLLA